MFKLFHKDKSVLNCFNLMTLTVIIGKTLIKMLFIIYVPPLPSPVQDLELLRLISIEKALVGFVGNQQLKTSESYDLI